MAFAYKDKDPQRKTYRIAFRDQHGVKRTVSSGLQDKGLARQLAAKIQTDVNRLRAGEPPLHLQETGPFLRLSKTGRTWQEFREEYRLRVLDGLAPRARSEAEDSLDRFERLAKPKAVAEITSETVDNFIVARRKEPGKKKGTTVSPATLNKDLRHVKAALRAAVEWSYLLKTPKVRFQREPLHLKRYVIPEHFSAIYQACDRATLPESLPGITVAQWWRSLLVLLYMTGWRIGQALSLRRAALDLANGAATAFCAAENTKGKRDALVPLHPLVIEHLAQMGGTSELCFPWPHDRRTLDVQWHRIQREAKIALSCHADHEHTPACHVYGFHDLRRAFATLNAGQMTPEVLQQLMQHQSFQTTRQYINLSRQLAPTLPRLYTPTLPPTGQAPQAEQSNQSGQEAV